MEPLGPAWASEALLGFHMAVSGQHLSGRALQLTERGYGVELMSGGQSVAAMLLSQKLGRLPGENPTMQPTSPVAPVVTASNTHSPPPGAAIKEPAAMVPELTAPTQENNMGPPREGPVKLTPTARENVYSTCFRVVWLSCSSTKCRH